MSPLLDAALRATVVLLIAGLVTLVLHRSAAATRHLIWVLTFAALVAVPVATTLLPSWRIAVLAPPASAPVRFEVAAVDAAARAAVPDRVDIIPPPVAVVAAAVADEAKAGTLPSAMWAWIVGLAITLGGLAVGCVRLWLLGRSAERVAEERWTSLVQRLSREIGLRRPVTLLRASGRAMPMTWGMRRPVILLPAEADRWPEAQRRQVLLHELAHVRRHDVLTQVVARVVCAAYWFHPLVWVAAARLRIERERACDDIVLRSGARPSDYAGHLLEIARSLRVSPATAFASVAMARPSQLALRLLDVLDAGRRRGVVTPRTAVPAAVMAAAIAIPLAIAAPVSRAQAPHPVAPRPITSAAELETLPRALRALVAQGPVVLGPAAQARDTTRPCENGSPRRHSSVHVNDGTAVHLTLGGCDIVFKAEGDFTFSDDFTDIATVSRGGEVIVELDDGRTLKRLVVRRGAGGALEREFTVDKDEHPFDAEAKAWLAQTLTLMFRHSGLAAEERATWILNRGGINALIEEIALLTGDYARRQYYDVALRSGKLDAAAVERLVQRAGEEIESDYELAELLTAVAKGRALTAGMQAGFVSAARTIQSDYERRRVLDAALTRTDLPTPVATAMLQVAGEMSSDYELAELLINMQQVRPIDDAVRTAFFGAANTLQSDYEHRRVLAAVCNGRMLSAAMLKATLESAATITSDYELAELLTEVAAQDTLDQAAITPYLAAAKTLQSDYEAGRTLRALAERKDLPAAALRSLLETSTGIASDHELAELLIDFARVHPINDDLRAAFDAAAATLQSDYEYNRVREATGRRGRGRAQLD